MTIFNLLLAVLMSLLPVETRGADAGGAAGGEPQPDPKPTPAPEAAGGAGGAGGGGPAGGGGEPAGRREAKQRADREAKLRLRARDAEERNSKLLTALRPALDALGIKVEGADVDPAELTKQVDTWKGKYMAERISNAVHRQAAALGARPDALMRYLRGGDELSELDPEQDNFEQELKSVIQRVLTDEPTLKVAPAAPPRSGADFNGGSGKTLDEQIAEAEK